MLYGLVPRSGRRPPCRWTGTGSSTGTRSLYTSDGTDIKFAGYLAAGYPTHVLDRIPVMWTHVRLIKMEKKVVAESKARTKLENYF